MVPRSQLPYVGVIGLGVVFVAFATYGLLALSGDPGLGAGIGRAVLYLFLGLGALAVLVAGVDLVRERRSEE